MNGLTDHLNWVWTKKTSDALPRSASRFQFSDFNLKLCVGMTGSNNIFQIQSFPSFSSVRQCFLFTTLCMFLTLCFTNSIQSIRMCHLLEAQYNNINFNIAQYTFPPSCSVYNNHLD